MVGAAAGGADLPQSSPTGITSTTGNGSQRHREERQVSLPSTLPYHPVPSLSTHAPRSSPGLRDHALFHRNQKTQSTHRIRPATDPVIIRTTQPCVLAFRHKFKTRRSNKNMLQIRLSGMPAVHLLTSGDHTSRHLGACPGGTASSAVPHSGHLTLCTCSRIYPHWPQRVVSSACHDLYNP